MPSAGTVLVAILVPVFASLFYSSTLEGGKHFQHLDSFKNLIRMAQGTPKLAVAPYEVPQPAFLYVAAETGELATTAEFNDWYDHEHVPLRLGHIPDFLSGARYEATDGKSPRYNALYDIKDFQLFSQPKYSNLRANRSPREANLVKRLDTLDRRTCKTIFDSGRQEYSAASTAPYITTLYIQPEAGKDAEMKSWLQNGMVNAMKAVPGWQRTSVHEVVDSLVISASTSPQSNTAAKYLIVNEWSNADSGKKAEDALHAAQSGSPAENAQIETRQWSLYRAWDNKASDKAASAPLNRLPPVYPPPGTSEIGDKIRVRRGPRGLTPLDGALMNAPEMANGWNIHVGAVRNKNSLPGDIRELLILRVAARNAAAYEWIHHEHVGRDAGLTTPQLVWLRDLSRRPPPVSSPGPFSPLQAAAFAFADESTWHSKIPQKVFNVLRSELAKQLPKGVTVEQQLTEVAVTTGTYNMVSRFLLAADVGEHANVLTPYPAADCQQRTIFVANGVTINTYVVKHADSENKPWIVLVNSLMTDYTMWDGVMSRLSENYNILAYDQRGHGKSSVPPEPCTLEQLADDIATLLHQLAIPTPIKAVIGVSQGGATTLKFAVRHGDKVEKLVICDTQVKSPEANIAAWDQRIEMARSKGMGALADATLPRWFPPESQLVQGAQEHLVRPMIEGTQVEGFVAGARALQGYDMSGEIAEALKDKKTLLIAGEKDGKLPEGLSKTQQELSGQGIDVQYFTVPGAGHLPMFVNNGLEAFLDRVEPFLRD